MTDRMDLSLLGRGVVKDVPVVLVAFLVNVSVTAFRADIDLLDPWARGSHSGEVSSSR